jgi:hypothetical protein
MAKADLEKELHVKTMKSSSNVIPKTQAYVLIGATLLLVICAGVLLASWRLGLLATADGGPQTAEVNSASAAPAAEPGVGGEVGSAQVDNVVLLQRLEQCRPECAGVDLAFIDVTQQPIQLDGLNLQGANLSNANLAFHPLNHSDLSGAKLNGANLHAAELKWANFTGADLSGAKLTFTILSAATLTDATLTGTDLTKARYDKNTVWPVGFNPEAAGAIFVGLR